MPALRSPRPSFGATRRPRPWFAGVVIICAVAAGGCGDAEPAGRAEDAGPPARDASLQPAVAGMPPESDTWYATRVLGSKVGWQHSVVRHVEHEGKPAVRTASTSHLVMRRGSSRVEMEVRYEDLIDAAGRLVRFTSEVKQMGTSIASRGRVEGGQLKIDTSTLGKTSNSSIPWRAEYGGPSAVEHSLTTRPMKPGETRTIKALLPVFNQLGTIELAARGKESVKLPGGTFELLRIEAATTFPSGQVIRDVHWTDRAGFALKMHSEAMDSESFVTSPQIAQDPEGLGELDFNLDTAVTAEGLLGRPHATRRVVYRVRLERGDPAAAFASGPSQQVESLDGRTARITVHALRPGSTAGNPDAHDDPPAEDDRAPNNLVQSDNPRLAALAREAVGNEEDPWKQVLALERFVHGYVDSKNFSTAFASAAEVAEAREGDCTEHAVLLAAMARALGIPARVAIGLVYQDGKFYYHMWTEVHVGGRWTAVDATLAKGGIGAAHLKLAHSHLKGGSAFSAFLPVVNVLGRGLEIEIVDSR